MHLFETTLFTPPPERAVDVLLLRKMIWQHPPGTPGSHYVAARVNHGPTTYLRRYSTTARVLEYLVDQRPLGIGQTTRIDLFRLVTPVRCRVPVTAHFRPRLLHDHRFVTRHTNNPLPAWRCLDRLLVLRRCNSTRISSSVAVGSECTMANSCSTAPARIFSGRPVLAIAASPCRGSKSNVFCKHPLISGLLSAKCQAPSVGVAHLSPAVAATGFPHPPAQALRQATRIPSRCPGKECRQVAG